MDNTITLQGGVKVGLTLKTLHALNIFTRLRLNSKPWQTMHSFKSLKTEDYLKTLVYPITVL